VSSSTKKSAAEDLVCVVQYETRMQPNLTFNRDPTPANDTSVNRTAHNMAHAMATGDNRDGPYSPMEEGEKVFLRHNRELCEKSAGRCQYLFVHDGLDMPPFWAKVQVMINTMSQHPECTFLYWLDSDAVIRRPDWSEFVDVFTSESSCGQVCNGGNKTGPEQPTYTQGHTMKSMVVSGEESNEGWGDAFNAGVWGVRNDATGRQILVDWMALYPPDVWYQDADGSWHCHIQENGWFTSDDQVCGWGGLQYEQATFKEKIQQQYWKQIARVRYSVLNYGGKMPSDGDTFFDCGVAPDTLVSHFSGLKNKAKVDTCAEELSAISI